MGSQTRSRWAVFALFFTAPLFAFVVLAEEVSDGERLGLDTSLSSFVQGHTPGVPGTLGDGALELAALLGASLVILLIGVLVARRRFQLALFVLTAIGGTLVLDQVLKSAFRRPPVAPDVHGYSFPSGSAMGSMALLATIVLAAGSNRRRLVLSLVGGCFVLAYGASIVDLRWHYPSDVLAGWLVSLAWVSGTWLAFRGPSLALPRETTFKLRLGVRRLLRRGPLDDALDWARFRIDTFPRRIGLLRFLGLPEMYGTTYHALPWVGLKAGRRVDSTASRLEAMLPVVRELEARSAIDIGANVGGFAFAFAGEGIRAIAVERVVRFVRIGLYARRKGGFDDASFLVMDINPTSVRQLPHADCTVYLSVWHHHVREFGLDGGSEILSALWERTDRVLFFETGEGEMPDSWGLPAGLRLDSRAWLTDYLRRTCEGSSVRHLGEHAALAPDEAVVSRHLFALVR